MQSAWLTIAEESVAMHQRLMRDSAHFRDRQNDILSSLLQCNCNTEFGVRYGFSDILSAQNPLESFQTQVPIQTYETLEKDIRSQMTGRKSLLAEPVLFYELTGGSSGGSKYIPYTQTTMQLLQAAIEPWLFDLVSSRPAITQGPSYWSVSPDVRAEMFADDGTRIGAVSDLEFMREELRAAFFATMVSPEAIFQADSYPHWQQLTLLTLLMNENLRLFSVWSPSFLTTLLGSLQHHCAWLVDCLNNPAGAGLGGIEWLGDSTQNQLAIDRLEASLSRTGVEFSVATSTLWPNLDTISCWTHGPAAGPASELQRWFPGVHIQPKGLLATEGVVTIPMMQSEFPILALNSGFFEFFDVSNQIVMPENLINGCDYRVLLTNGSGLYRYDIGDQVRMQGTYHQIPMLEFTGRANNTSDLTGEKLEEQFVSSCMNHSVGFSMLAPHGNHYCLYVEQAPAAGLPGGYDKRASELDRRLYDNPQYRYARELGQLEPVQLCGVPDLAKHHIEWQQKKGQLIGDIKPIALCTDKGFIAYLDELVQ